MEEPKEKIEVRTYLTSEYNIDWEYSTIQEISKLLTEIEGDVKEGFPNFDNYNYEFMSDYNRDTVDVDIYGVRLETDEEFEQRKEDYHRELMRKGQAKIEADIKERELYEKLKAKYDG